MQTTYFTEPLTTLTSKILRSYIRRYDLPEFGNAVFEAWRQLDSQARAMDALCFPAWCRFELLDHEGNSIFTSESELLGSDDSDIHSIKVALNYKHSPYNILPAPITRRAWRPEVSISDIPIEFRDKAVKVNIFVRSTVDFPEWSLPAEDLVECLYYNRVIMSPKPETDERLYKSITLSSQKTRNSTPRRPLLSRRPHRLRRQRKMIHSGIRRMPIRRSINAPRIINHSYSPARSVVHSHSFLSPVVYDSFLPPPREPPHSPVPLISDG